MKTLVRRFAILATAALALGAEIAPPEAPAAAASPMVYVDDTAANNSGITCPTTPYTTIQQGVDNAPDGATVSVCQGSYSDTVGVLGRNNLKLIAKGNVSLTAPGGFTGNFIGVFGSNNITIQGFLFDGGRALGTADTTAIGVAASSVSILKNTIKSWREPGQNSGGGNHVGIYIDNGINRSNVVKIDHNTIHDYENFGIEIQNQDKVSVTHNLLMGSSSGNYNGVAISLSGGIGGSVTANVIRNDRDVTAGGSLSDGIDLREVSLVKVSGNTITGPAEGIRLLSQCTYGFETSKNTISANKINDTFTAIYIQANFSSCAFGFTGNILSGNKIATTGIIAGAPIAILAQNGTEPITGTQIKGNTIAGYDLNSDYVDISGASVTGTVKTGNKLTFAPTPGA